MTWYNNNIGLLSKPIHLNFKNAKFELTVRTSQFVKQLAKWVKKCKTILTLRRESCEVQVIQVMINKINIVIK